MPASLPRPALDPQNSALLVYVADLELEVDRLRKYCQLLVHETGDALNHIRQQCTTAAPPEDQQNVLSDIESTAAELAARLAELQTSGDHHPAHDQVTTIDVGPLVQQIFSWQQRVHSAPRVALRLELHCEAIAWFPGRLRHILENLISNALKYRDAGRGETRICVELTAHDQTYELRISDNGLGIAPPRADESSPSETSRSSPDRAATLGVGLAVVKLLVEQSGGTMTTHSGDGQGTTQVVALPRYDLDDFLS